jgi:hypothetical protein
MTVTWFNTEGQQVGSGSSVIVSPKSSTCYYAVARNDCQRAASPQTCVTVSDQGGTAK